MKKFRKLIPAFIMLLVSAILVSTATYAWFSMNATVQATGMQISAKNESGSLIIGAQKYTGGSKDAEPTLTSVQTANLTSIDLSATEYNYTTSFAVKPSAHNTGLTNKASYDSAANWYFKVANLPSSYESNGAPTALSSFTDYVIYYDLYITVAQGSPAMQNLKCNVSIQASGDSANVRDAVRVVVASSTAQEEFYNAHTEGPTATEAHTTGTTVLASSVTNSALVPIRVYIYVDGEDATIFTNNFNNLKSTTVELSFTAENTP